MNTLFDLCLFSLLFWLLAIVCSGGVSLNSIMPESGTTTAHASYITRTLLTVSRVLIQSVQYYFSFNRNKRINESFEVKSSGKFLTTTTTTTTLANWTGVKPELLSTHIVDTKCAILCANGCDGEEGHEKYEADGNEHEKKSNRNFVTKYCVRTLVEWNVQRCCVTFR